MEFKPDMGGFIQDTEARKMIDDYQKANPDKIRSYFMGKDVLQKLLNNPGTGIRVYLAQAEDGTETCIMYTNDLQGKDIGSPALNSEGPCPPWCPVK